MPTIVLKESPDVDFYVGWSSVVEAPVWGGDRAFALTQRDVTNERLDRADATGTSAQWVTAAGMRDRFPEQGSWEDWGEIYEQRGTVSRANIFVLTRRLLQDEGADVTDLLKPLDDESEVRPA